MFLRTVARQTKNRPKWPFLVFFGLAWYLVKFFNGVNLALTAFFQAWPVLGMGKKKGLFPGLFYGVGCALVYRFYGVISFASTFRYIYNEFPGTVPRINIDASRL